MGRKPKLTPHQKKEILRRKENGEAVREIARSHNVHNSTISRLDHNSGWPRGRHET
jgi:IS30 family transposase